MEKKGLLRKFFLFLLLIIFLLYSLPASDFSKYKNAIMLQGFHWFSWKGEDGKSWYQILREKASIISQSGINLIWFPPPSASASPEGYLPHEWYNLNSKYGTEKALREAIKECHKYKVKVLADIVINHRVGRYDWADFKNPEWGPEAVCSDDEWPWAKGNKDTGSPFGAGRDIDHTQFFVRESIIKWLRYLKEDIGFDGWRYDFVKGYAGKYIKIYNDETEPYFSVGEFWDYLIFPHINKHRQQLCDWINSTGDSSCAFDFTTKGILQKAFQDGDFSILKDQVGKPAGLIGWWPEAAITFIDNHDTGPSPDSRGKNAGQNHWPFPSKYVLAGYAYILTHPGIPCIYWPHYFNWGIQNELNKLIALRRKLGINSQSKVEIVAANTKRYAVYIDGKLALCLGDTSWQPQEFSSPKLIIHGEGFSIWVDKGF